MKSAFGIILGVAYFVFLIWGFARWQNVTEDAFGALGVPPGTTDPCEFGAGPWRPEGGLIDGQGCWAGGEDGNERGAGCGYLESPESTYDFLVPYFRFTPFTRKGDAFGGQIIFDWRTHNQSVLPLLFAWLGLLIPLICLARAPWVGLQKWRRRKLISCCACPFAPRRGWFNPADWFGWLWELNRGQAIMTFWTVVQIFLFGCYLYNHAVMNNLVGPVSRAFGGMAVGGFPLLLFPALRHSPLVPTFGMSFDRSIALHRRIGVIIFVCVTIHWVLIAYAHSRVYHRGQPSPDYDYCNQTMPREFVDPLPWGEAIAQGFRRLTLWNIGFPHGPPLAGLISWICMLFMVLAANFLRRDRWEVFVIIHMLYVVVYVMVWIHYPTTLILCIPLMLCFVYDMMMRRWRMRKPHRAKLTFFPEAQVTEIRIQIQDGTFPSPWPGSWVTVHLPDAELDQATRFFRLEHHPFSVSSVATTGAQHDDLEITLHCKVMGEQVFTSRLALLPTWYEGGGEGEEGETTYPIYVDGPFGNLSPPLGLHSNIFLIGGGIGVTPLINTLDLGRDLVAPGSRMSLIWSVPSESLVIPFRNHLETILKSPDQNCQVSVFIYVTRKAQKGAPLEEERGTEVGRTEKTGLLAGYSTPHPTERKGQVQEGGGEWVDSGIVWETGRPDFGTLLPQNAADAIASVVYVCGPPPLVRGVSDICVKRDIDFHTESFLF